MSIDKESSGVPQVNPRRWTTKINFGIIIAIVIFFAAMALVYHRFAGQ